MPEVSLPRLYALRAMYLLLLVGLATDIWPLILNPPDNLEHFRGVVWSMLTAISLVAVLGIRYPLKMLPLLFFEFTWKLIWLVAIGFPLFLGDRFDTAHRETWFNCWLGVVLVPLVIPWRYVFATYVKAPADRWRKATA